MKRSICLMSLVFVIAILSAEIRYIEIDNIKNASIIEIKSVEDFEAIINEYGIKIGYLNKNTPNTVLFIVADSVYFSFAMNGYYTLTDYKTGQANNFKNGTDYNSAKALGFDTSEIYYYYKRNSFNSVDDCKDAYKKGFVNVLSNSYEKKGESSVYYEAKYAGYSNYSEYKEYLDYVGNGFKNKSDWQNAQQKGFYKGGEYYLAIENGFMNYSDFNSARQVGISNNEDYKLYSKTIGSFERIMKEYGIEKKSAVIYFYIQNLPKGDIGLSALSNSLNDLYSKQSKSITEAINKWYSDAKTNEKSSRNYKEDFYMPKKVISITTIFTQKELSNFFENVDYSLLGTYNSKTEIFRRK